MQQSCITDVLSVWFRMAGGRGMNDVLRRPLGMFYPDHDSLTLLTYYQSILVDLHSERMPCFDSDYGTSDDKNNSDNNGGSGDGHEETMMKTTATIDSNGEHSG